MREKYPINFPRENITKQIQINIIQSSDPIWRAQEHIVLNGTAELSQYNSIQMLNCVVRKFMKLPAQDIECTTYFVLVRNLFLVWN